MSDMGSSFLSEREISSLVQSCNLMLTKTTIEQDQLKKATLDIQKETTHLQGLTQGLQQQQRQLKKQNDEREYALEEKKRSLSYLQALLTILNKQDQPVDLSLSPEWIQLQDDNIDASTKEHKAEEIKHQIQQGLVRDQLQAYYEEVRFESMRMKEEVQVWTCKRCNIRLNENENTKSCIHHPGKLKYYSCRSCGDDEYFTCCNKCRKCSVGCFTSTHQP